MENNNQKFIIYIITRLELGGAQKVCLGLFDHFAKQNRAALFAGAGGILDANFTQNRSVKLFPALQNNLSLRGLWSDIKAFWQLYRAIRETKQHFPNLVVHTHSTKAGILGRWAAKFAGVKHIVHTLHGFGFNAQQPRLKFWVFWFLEWLTNFVTTTTIFVSEHDMDYACQKMRFSKHRCQLIRASAMHIPTTMQISKHKSNKIVIGSVSCFKPQKNLLALLEAFRRLKLRLHRRKPKLQLRLLLVGDGPQKSQIFEFINSHQLTDQVKLCGWQNDLTNFYQQIDIFALSSLWEGLPCAAVEALLFAKPVVAFDVGGLSEIISNGYNGFLAQPGDVFSLSQKLEFCVENPQLTAHLQQARKNYGSFFEGQALQQHSDLYTQI